MGGLITAALLAAGFWEAYYLTNIVWVVRKAGVIWIPVLLILAALFVVALLLGPSGSAKKSGRDRHDSRTGSRAVGWLALTGLAGGLATIAWWFAYGYLQDRDYLSSVTVTTAPAPQFGERAPYTVARAQVRANLGDATGNVADTSYDPVSDRYTTLLERRGAFTGYESVATLKVPVIGAANGSSRCAFSRTADARVGGWLGHNLGRKIAQERRWVSFDDKDVYAYCDSGNVPKVVVPLKKLQGFFVVTERPAGVAIYDGKTGEITFSDGAGLPGPAYPMSLAASQRESTHAMSGYWDWLWQRGGWETDDSRVNAENNTEFGLASGGKGLYSTSLTPRGSATAITAISVIPAHGSGGKLAPLTVHRLAKPWKSPDAIAQNIRSSYGDLQQWATRGFEVFEVTPTSGETFLATIGHGQVTKYVVRGSGSLAGAEPHCLYEAAAKRGCGRVESATEPAPTTPGDGKIPADIRNLKDEELLELQRRLQQEIANRLRR
ncbi:hypothetical protein D5H75_33565 [Bailinhaonella thermotolerans]|uniref:Uncharacterized protein n=1 Tax=Bailinhaonella thermotolerans TaxID=1070861 RepID=A0A3A4A5Z0_9ACTN|nr:hypothetical protein D5H75_33565 [Bailinhaonella thermotolerans]